MTKLDILILVVFVASVAWGFRKGVIEQAGALGGILLGVVLCRIGSPWMIAVLAGEAEPTYVDSVLARIILFLAGYLSVRIVAKIFKSATHALSLGGLDRLGGALFCMLEWMLGLSLLLNLYAAIKPQTDWQALSHIGNGHAIDAIVGFAPCLMGQFTN